ncbi:hypothetical protein GJA_4221 [Janthinobacterium agaricidamnosum NBRC 102515 = DSM 9628]|uniref:Uncharacterized protein n=1 Tax=Janthinobacterium agaricidamnosum NBRC 102515 = DSM 9628 TaxID=1349767 RepID=W0VAB6_9BURK|nr:hypothetical protein GJA_4221 [Janthinobacterium agaricidamnosum NBRC 102515 = DSM 9628]
MANIKRIQWLIFWVRVGMIFPIKKITAHDCVIALNIPESAWNAGFVACAVHRRGVAALFPGTGGAVQYGVCN